MYVESHHDLKCASVYGTSSSLILALNKLLRGGLKSEESILISRARKQLESSFHFCEGDSVASYVRDFYHQTSSSPITLFAELVDRRDGLGDLAPAGKSIKGKSDIASMLFIFFFFAEHCVMRVLRHTDRKVFCSTTLVTHLSTYGADGVCSFFLFLLDFNNDHDSRKRFIIRCLGNLGPHTYPHSKQAFLASHGLLPVGADEFLHMPYDLVADPKCSEVVASANFHFFVCERTSNAEVFRHSYEKVVRASSCRITVYGCSLEHRRYFCYFGRSCRFLGKDYIFPVRHKVFCNHCGKVLDPQEAVESMGFFFCVSKRKEAVGACLISSLAHLVERINFSSPTSQEVFSLMRPTFTFDKDLKLAVLDFMRKAFVVGNVSALTGKILDAYVDLTKTCIIERGSNFKSRLVATGIDFDDTRFQGMLLLHKFLIYTDYICFVAVHFKPEKYRAFLRSPCFKDIGQMTSAVLHISNSSESLLLPVTSTSLQLDPVGILVMMSQCYLGFTQEEHAVKLKIIDALLNRGFSARVRTFLRWTRFTALYQFILRVRGKSLSSAFQLLRDSVTRNRRWMCFCNTLRDRFRRYICSQVIKSFVQNVAKSRRRLKKVDTFQTRLAMRVKQSSIICWRGKLKIARTEARVCKHLNYKRSILAYNIFRCWKRQVRSIKIKKATKTILCAITFCAYIRRLRAMRLSADAADILHKSTLKSNAKPFVMSNS
jgi:hypothetical protein